MTAQANIAEAPEQKTTLYAWYVLLLLFTVYVLNFADRILLVSLFTSVKKEFALSNFETALLGTTAFVLFYTILGLPFGKLADSVSRTKLIAAGLTVWSFFSGVSGMTENFWQLFLCRVMVGVGEATLGPAALSLLSDYFPPKMRATVQAIYSSAIAGGTALSFFAGTAIDATLGWRWAFYLIGFSGIPVAVLVLLLREPTRGVLEQHNPMSAAQWTALFKLPTLWLHHMGYAGLAVAANSLTIWLPTYFVTAFGMAKTDVGFMVALYVILGGLGGTILGGAGADELRKRQNGGRLLLMSVIALASAALWALFLLTENLLAAQLLYFALMSASLAWLGPAAADVHDIVGTSLRGIGIALYFFVVNIIGYGVAPPIVGALSDALSPQGAVAALRTALFVCPIVLCISALTLWLASKRLDEQKP